jgi:hypothetical protein
MLQLKRPTVHTGLIVDDFDHIRCLPWVIDLTEWLRLTGYSLPERQRILTSLLDHGSLEHVAQSGLLDREDRPLADAIFCESQPEVPQDDPQWDDSEVWELGPAIPPGTVLVPPELDNDDDLAEPAARPDWRNWEDLVNSWKLPPVSGGAPVPAVFERLALSAEKIRQLQAELDRIPPDWSENYYPWLGDKS